MFLGYTSRFRLKAPRKEIEETQSSVRHSVCPFLVERSLLCSRQLGSRLCWLLSSAQAPVPLL